MQSMNNSLADEQSIGSTSEGQGKDYVAKTSVREEANEIYESVVEAFAAKQERDADNKRFWDIYNCKLTDEQAYSGNSEIYIPVVRDAIEARTLRFSNALFPSNDRFVECISSTEDRATALVAMLNHYVRESRLRETITGALRSGDITGQYSVYVGWSKRERTITQRTKREVHIEGVPTGIEVDDIEEVTLTRGSPDVWVVADEDLAVIPPTVDTIEDADTVAVAIRVTKSWIRKRKSEFTPKMYKLAMSLFGNENARINHNSNPEKARSYDAGVRSEKGTKFLLLYEIWTDLELDGERVPAVILAAGADTFLSIKKNPYWGQQCPVISAPAKKVPGSFWGVSAISPVENLQYQANDAINMGMDAAQYALMPIIMTDPLKNPRVDSMVLEMAAVWLTNPSDTQLVKFPPLWQDALQILAATKSQIHESFGLNPAMLPTGGAPGRKPTQAQVAQEQALALESTADAIRVLEGYVLSPLVERMFEYDQQFRDKDLLVPHYGELGFEAGLDTVPPIQFGSRYQFVWNGTERGRNAQRVGQMISMMNVLRGIPPQQLGGRQLDIGPILDQITDTVFGPRIAPRVLKEVRNTLSLDPMLENEMLISGMPLQVQVLDNDAAHIQAHHMAGQATGDVHHTIAAHLQLHMMQQQRKQAAMAPQAGAPGVPGGDGPGVPGTPRPGGMPTAPRNVQQPNGAIHPDQMRDPSAMPRKM
jgi:hypothetical protein